MDFSDDVSYSVGDVEDTVITSKYDLTFLEKNADEIIDIAQKFYAKEASNGQLKKAVKTLVALPFWVKQYIGDDKNVASIKNMTSELIARFVSSVFIEKQKLVVPAKTQNEIAILKAFSYLYFINTPAQQKLKLKQRKLIENVFNIYSKTPAKMKKSFYYEYKKASGNKMLQKRIIIDQIASLTDVSLENI
jgi:dGTPase